jgi:DNA invertase Pin-like site-specific DNA recombinase
MKTHTVYKTFHTEGRREFVRITEDVQSALGIILVPKLSRFGRNMRQSLEPYDLLEESGVDLAFLDLRVDTSTGPNDSCGTS